MDLKGAEIRNFYLLTDGMPGQNNESSFMPENIKIPHYQRPYKWNSDNIEKLIDDWNNEAGDSYFSGSIVTVNEIEKQHHSLIDGQQRYTTIFLTNFVRFLLCRVTIRQAIAENKVINISALLDSLIHSSKFLICNHDNEKTTFNQELLSLRDKIMSPFEDGEEQPDLDAIQLSYAKAINLPTCVEEDVNYSNLHSELLLNLLSSKQLKMSYDRSSFNKSLINVLSRIYITLSNQSNPKLNIIDEDKFSDVEKIYVEAIQTIFNKFYNVSNNKQTFFKAKSIIDTMTQFLNEIKLCVVQTGNPDDAYTLFEVLNDRSLALDDLDLIKNQFYKTYVIKNPLLNSDQIDILLQKLDDLWVDNIFSNCTESSKKLITYLAVTYLTGSTTITHSKSKDCREAVNNYLKKKNSYTEKEIIRDFNIFKTCKTLIETSKVMSKTTDIRALKSEYSTQDSVLSKTIHFLIALKQEGVLAGLTCYLLNVIRLNKINITSFNSPSDKLEIFEPVHMKEILTSLLSNERDNIVEKESQKIWQCSMLSKSANRPREYAVALIKSNNVSTSTIDTPLINYVNDIDCIKEFKDWVNNWKYGDNQLKARLLFAKLIQLKPSDGAINTLEKATISLNLTEDNIVKLQLDHMEASNIDEKCPELYFQNEEREFFVNGFGNMMPLPSKENQQKSNKPFKNSFYYIEQAGIPKSHFLYTTTKELYDKYKDGDGIPSTKMFTERKELLQEYFLSAIKSVTTV